MMVTVKLDESDYVAAQALHNKLSRNKLIFYVLAVAILVGIGVVALAARRHVIAFGALGAVIGGAIGHYAVCQFYVPWKARRIFRQQKSLHREHTLSWDADALTTRDSTGQFCIPWSDYVKWKESDELFLLYHSDLLFQMVPKRVFTDAERASEFRRLLQTKIVA